MAAAAIDGGERAGAKVEVEAPEKAERPATEGAGRDAGEAFSAELASAAADAGPPPAREAKVDRQGDRAVVDAGDGDDVIDVRQDGERVTVSVNGEEHVFEGEEAANLLIEAGDGDDRVRADSSVSVGLSVEGGAGCDTLTGGDGRDYLNGSRGDDVITGRGGDDVIYGGDGADDLRGSDGDDYVEGSAGNDSVRGNEGDDIVSGGVGDDLVVGNAGNDVLYAGAGRDAVFGMGGDDVMYAERGTDDYVGGGGNDRLVDVETGPIAGLDQAIVVDPNASPEFRERFAADLALLQSSPNGRQMLEALAASGHTVTIEDSTGTANWVGFDDSANAFYDPTTGAAGAGSDSDVRYDPQRIEGSLRDPTDPAQDWKDRPPIIGLYHELAHAYNGATGTLQPGYFSAAPGAGRDDRIDDRARNLERQAIGLPSTPDAPIPDTPNPTFATENGLRDEMGLPLRPRFDYKEVESPRPPPGGDD